MVRPLLKQVVYGAIIGISALGAAAALAWTGATSTPPGGNVNAPLNVGATSQTKSGNLTVGSLTLNGVLKSSWPAGASVNIQTGGGFQAGTATCGGTDRVVGGGGICTGGGGTQAANEPSGNNAWYVLCSTSNWVNVYAICLPQ